MPLFYDEGQQAIAAESRRIVEARMSVERLLPLLEREGAFDMPFWAMAKEQGWTALAIPESHSGLGLGLVEMGLVALACGTRTSGAPFLTPGYGVARALSAFGTGALKDSWLPALASGDAIGAVGFAERQAPLPVRPELTFAGGRLTGVKPAVTGGAHASVALVLACEDGTPVLALADLSGVVRHSIDCFDNSRCVADLAFAQTPATLLASGDAAIAAARDTLAAMAVVAAHEQTGGAEALMLQGRDYALTRRAFGQPIGAFQSVKHRIAELYGLVELARAASLAAAAADGTPGFLRAAAAARIAATEAYDTATRDVVQIHGGIGVTWEAGLHLHSRRARSFALEFGNLLFWEDLLVDELETAA
jgi:acyl-CoA dehydrogenase